MDFFTIGNINAYTKNLKLQAMWDTKKRSGDVTAHRDTGSNWMMEDLERQRENDKLARITNKVLNGRKLTGEERDYLRSKSPQAYQQLLQSEQEQKAFENELRRCETKEDVLRLKTDRINAALSVVKSVENNPHINAEQALGIAMAQLAKVQAYERTTLKFIKSGEYDKLPTEAERAQANEDAREAEEARRNPEAERPGEERPVKDAAERPAEDAAEPSQRSEGEDRPERTASPGEDTARAPQAERPERPAVEPDTPEQRKVRRAKAKAAYAAARQAPAVPETPQTPLNLRA